MNNTKTNFRFRKDLKKHMNSWMKKMMATLIVFAQFVAVPVISAEASTTNQKEKIQIELKQTQKELDKKLSEASEITMALEELAKEIDEQENSILETEKEIVTQEELVEERYDHTAEQLKAMQKSEVNQNIIIGLLQSKNFSDFINRLYTMSVLTSANEELLREAHHEYEKLNEMKEELVVTKEALDEKQKATDQQKAVLDKKLSELQSTLAMNQEKLEKINAQEAAAKAAAEKSAAKAQENNASVSSSNAAAMESNKPVTNSNSEANSGAWMTFQSTGYSTQQAGLSTHTATGINLLVNPRVIAVDPSQIPLGSLVEVEGMGVYVAGDTGGAIKGRIIDVHFPTVGQALSWGRRSVRIRILN